MGIKAIDDKRLEVTLDRPVSSFDGLMAFPVFYPINETVATQHGEQYGTTPETYVGNGP